MSERTVHLREIDARLDASTPGTWKAVHEPGRAFVEFASPGTLAPLGIWDPWMDPDDPLAHPTTQFIIHAAADLAWAVALLRDLIATPRSLDGAERLRLASVRDRLRACGPDAWSYWYENEDTPRVGVIVSAETSGPGYPRGLGVWTPRDTRVAGLDDDALLCPHVHL